MIDATWGLRGPVTDEDEGWRPPTSEEQFSDSFYFGLGADDGWGLYTRIGRRANEGVIEAAMGVYLPNGRFTMLWKRARDELRDAIAAGPIAYTCGDPFAVWEITARGEGRIFPSAADLGKPGARFDVVDVEIDLRFSPWTGPIAFMGSETVAGGGGEELARGVARRHYEQAGEASGSVVVDGRELTSSLRGMRDHSWGVRDWQAVPFWRWACAPFGRDLAVGVSNVGGRDGTTEVGGWLLRDGVLAPVRQTQWRSTMDEDRGCQRAFAIDVRDDTGRDISLEADVVAVASLRQRRGKQVTMINEGLTRYRIGNRTAHGISEYLLQP